VTGPRRRAVDAHDVRVTLGGRPILDGVTFSLEPGEFAGLIGANGSGKTTLLRVLLGLQHPSSGTAALGGAVRRRRAVGYVPQKVVLDPDLPMRARDLVSLGVDGHRFGVPLPNRARRARVEELLAAVGAEPFADARVGRLSGGEQQRVLIAHALAGRPEVLILDEPLANLDLRAGNEVVALLHRVARDGGVTVLLSAHEINPLVGVMDRVIYLAAGRAVSGTVADVVRSDVLSALYGYHVDVVRVHGRIIVVPAQAGSAEQVPAHPPIEVR
jgi:zinc/manganese transport system ATP-binding protein